MVSVAYSEAVAEVLDILRHTKKEDVDKIPKSFMNYLEEKKSKNYVPDLDHSKSIKDMGIKSKTAALLGMIYIKYWADEKEKEKFLKKANENEKVHQEELREKYNVNDIFKVENNTNKEITKNENLLMAQKENINIFMKIWNKLKKFLNIKS